ncbi:MAG: EamA family transporter [Muribaculaceae bacterium]|nr:EamA family transporter [Muribaculaceae bacterium]
MKDTSGSKDITTPRTARQLILGNSAILLATIFFGINIPAIKFLIPDWLSADAITAIRLIGGCALMWVTSLFLKNDRIIRADWLKVILGGAVGLFLFIYLFIQSLRFCDPIDISIIMTLPPVFVVLIGVLFLHRRPSLIEYLGIVVAFAGAVIIITYGNGSSHGAQNLLGMGLAVASTICYAFYLIILEGPTHRYRPVSLLRWVFLFAAVPAAAVTLWGFDSNTMFHSSEAAPWLWAIFVLVGPTYLAYFLVQPANKLIGSELVSLYQYLVPVVATAASVIMGIARLHWIQVLAMAVIVGGMLLTTLGKRRRVRKTAANS